MKDKLDTRAEPYDDAQIRRKLMEIRDKSIEWWLDMVKKRGKTGAAQHSFEKAMNELNRLDNVVSGLGNARKVTIEWGAAPEDDE